MVPSCKLNRLLRLHHREGNVIPIQYSCLEKSHGWRSLVGCSPWGCEESATTERLHFHFPALEKEMATHCSVLAWRIPGMGEPGGLPSMGSHRVGHYWSDLAASAAGYTKFLIWLNILLSTLWPKSAFPMHSQSCKVRNQMILSLTPWICVLSLIMRLSKITAYLKA